MEGGALLGGIAQIKGSEWPLVINMPQVAIIPGHTSYEKALNVGTQLGRRAADEVKGAGGFARELPR